MAIDKCLEEITKAAGRRLSKAEASEIERRVADTLKAFDLDALDGAIPEIIEAVLKEADEIKAAAYITKRNAAFNARAQTRFISYINNTWSDDIGGGFRSLILGTLVKRKGSHFSIASAVDTSRYKYSDTFGANVFATGHERLAKSGTLDREIFEATAIFDSPSEAGSARLKELHSAAVELAVIYRNSSEGARLDRNAVGAWTVKHPGYVVKRSADPDRVAKFAGDDIQVGDPRHKVAWKAFIRQEYDLAKSFPEASPARHETILDSLFDQFATGEHLNFDQAIPSPLKGFSNLGRKSSHARVLVAKSWEGDFKYFQRLSGSSSIYESMFHGLSTAGKDIAIMQTAGPNARANIDSTRDFFREKMIKDGAGAKNVRAMLDEYDKVMNTGWGQITGEAHVGVRNALQKTSSNIRGVQALADLGSIVLASFNDISNAASALSFSGERTFFTYARSTVNVVHSLISHIPDAERNAFAAEARIGLEGIFSPIDPVLDLTGSQRLHKANHALMKYSGARTWTNRIRVGSVSMYSNRLAANKGMSFKNLPPGVQDGFLKHGLTEQDWNLMRQSDTMKLANGSELLTPDRATKSSDDVFRKIYGEELSDAQVSRIRRDFDLKMSTMFQDLAATVSSRPTTTIRAIMHQGTVPGTWTGEAIRHMTLYKSYPIAYMRNHLGRELHGYHADRVSTAEAMARVFKDGHGQGGGLTTLIIGGMFWGGVSLSLTDIAKGKEPSILNIKDQKGVYKFLFEAGWKSGAFGLYGDLVLGQATGRSGVETIAGFAGPTVRRMGSVLDIINDAKNGEFEARRTWKAIYDALPGRSLLYTRGVTDYLLLYNFSELLNPGYLDRMEKRAEDRGEKFILSPEETVG